MRLKLLALAVMLSSPLADARALPKVTVQNRSLFATTVTISYAGCRGDRLAVPAGRRNSNGTIAAGSATTGNRGACLITKITATLTGSSTAVTEFASKGSGASAFTIAPVGAGFRVYLDSELPR